MWEQLSFLQGRVRRQTLEALAEGPRTPTTISESTGEHLSHVSRALKELVDHELIECMTPGHSKNRIYRITDMGRKALENLSKMSIDK